MKANGKLPSHVGIIMDGNGRWAESRGLPRIEGHRRGAERAREIINAARDTGIKALTLYTFSMENWQRPKAEVAMLMKLLDLYLSREMHEFLRRNIRFRAIGDVSRLPGPVAALVKEAEALTIGCTSMTFFAALSYGGRDEIIRAVKKIAASGTKPEEINEDTFARLLDTAGVTEPDLIIRTSGEQRMSNFLLWQSAYSELYFTDVFWPDFGKAEFEEALREYRFRDRRFGAVRA